MRQRLLAIVGIAILPLGVGLISFFVSTQRGQEQEVRLQALRTSEIVALEMERIVTGAESVLRTLAVTPEAIAPGCEGYLARVDAMLPQLAGFRVVSPAGDLICAAGALEGEASAGEPALRSEAARDGIAVGLYTHLAGQAPLLPVAIVAEDAPVRVLITGIDVEWIGARLRERNFAQGSALAIADRGGTIVAREPESGTFVGAQASDTIKRIIETARAPGTIEVHALDGVDRVIGFQPPLATQTGLYVGSGISTEEAYSPVRGLMLRVLLLALAGALAACLFAWYVGDRLFRRPIRRMLGTIARWQAGDERARIRMSSADRSELATLGAAIDDYMDNLACAHAEREAAEQRRTLLLREMNHRIKNILAAVQAIANQTFKQRATADSLRAFGDRLSAMAAAHDLLVAENWESADLRATVEAAVRPFSADRQQRFVIEGPPMRITAQAAFSLSMALHELCTNAAKYGALSVPEGRVDLGWRLEDGRFRMTWTESGGPEVEEPEQSGFGTRLISRALAMELGGTAELTFAPAGLRFELDGDAAIILATAAAGAKGRAA